jgi:hypothetical protein
MYNIIIVMCRQAVEWIARNEYRGRDAAAVDPISIVRSTYLYYPSLIIIIIIIIIIIVVV